MHYVFSFQVKDCVKELGKLLYPLLIHRQSKVFLNFRPNYQISRLSLFHSTNYSTSSRAGRALYWSNYKIINNSNGQSSNLPEMMREGELPLISISERALATKVRQQLQFSSNYESTPMFLCRTAMAGERREKRCAAKISQSRSPSRTSSRSPPSSPSSSS